MEIHFWYDEHDISFPNRMGTRKRFKKERFYKFVVEKYLKVISGTTTDLLFYYTMSDGHRLIPKSLNVTHTWVDIRLINGIKTPRKGLFLVQ